MVDFLFPFETKIENTYCQLIICAHNKWFSHLFHRIVGSLKYNELHFFTQINIEELDELAHLNLPSNQTLHVLHTKLSV